MKIQFSVRLGMILLNYQMYRDGYFFFYTQRKKNALKYFSNSLFLKTEP